MECHPPPIRTWFAAGTRQTAVPRFEGEIGKLGHENLVGHAPRCIVPRVRSRGPDLPAVAVNRHAAHQVCRGALVVRLRFDAGANQHIAARPTFHGDAAVGTGIDVQSPDRR